MSSEHWTKQAGDAVGGLLLKLLLIGIAAGGGIVLAVIGLIRLFS